jgi:hypothetical protein
MLINAMEVTGIEGTYRSTCESTMEVNIPDIREILIFKLSIILVYSFRVRQGMPPFDRC